MYRASFGVRSPFSGERGGMGEGLMMLSRLEVLGFDAADVEFDIGGSVLVVHDGDLVKPVAQRSEEASRLAAGAKQVVSAHTPEAGKRVRLAYYSHRGGKCSRFGCERPPLSVSIYAESLRQPCRTPCQQPRTGISRLQIWSNSRCQCLSMLSAGTHIHNRKRHS